VKGKRKDYGKTKSLDDLLEEEKRSVKRGLIKRKPAQNFFPFNPVRPDRPNALGLFLDKWDCRILRGVQQYGFKPVGEFCKLAKVKPSKFYERFRNNPDLKEALRLLAFSSLAIAFPKAMSTLSEKFSESAPWAKLYCEVTGLIDSPSLKVGKAEEETDRLMDERELRYLIGE
jgi:hypothetical protein